MPTVRKSYRKQSRYPRPPKLSRQDAMVYPMRRAPTSRQSKRVADIGLGFPDLLKVQLRYTQLETISGTINGSYGFRLNSIYDPDATGVGTQPLYHDQLAALYDKYRVVGAKVKVQVNNNQAVPTQVVIGDLDDGAYTDVDGFIQQAGSEAHIMGLSTGGMGVVEFNKYFNIAERTGQDKDDNSLSAVFSNNPGSPWYLLLKVRPCDKITNVNISFSVDIVYYVECFDRADVAQS